MSWPAFLEKLTAIIREIMAVGLGAYIQQLRQEAAIAKDDAAVARADGETALQNIKEFEEYRRDADGNAEWLRKWAGSVDPTKL